MPSVAITAHEQAIFGLPSLDASALRRGAYSRLQHRLFLVSGIHLLVEVLESAVLVHHVDRVGQDKHPANFQLARLLLDRGLVQRVLGQRNLGIFWSAFNRPRLSAGG